MPDMAQFVHYGCNFVSAALLLPVSGFAFFVVKRKQHNQYKAQHRKRVSFLIDNSHGYVNL